MQVSLETTQGLERRMTISIPAERIENEVENRLRNLSRTVRLKGFRPGKVPLKVVESRYGPVVRREVVDEVTRTSFYEAVSRERLQLAGLPRFHPRVIEPGRDLEYEAVFEVLDKIELAPLAQIEIARPVADITEEDIDRMVDNLRRQRGQWQDVEQPAREADRLVIDFTGRIDGVEFPGNKGERVTVLIGAGKFIPGFEEGLIGMSPGETRFVDVRFPEKYHVGAVAGKLALFEMKVYSVSILALPEVDEAFIRSFDIAEGTMDALRVELRKTMHEEMAEAIRDRIRKQALEALYRENLIEVPRSQVDAQCEALMKQTRDLALGQGVPEGEITLDPSMFEEQARRRVVLGRLILEIARKQNFAAEPDRVRQRVEAIAAGYENPEEVYKWYYSDRSRLASIEQLVVEDHVVDWVVSQARITEERTDFMALLKERQKQ